MKSRSSAVAALFVLVALPCAYAQTPAQAPTAEPPAAAAPARSAQAMISADPLPSSLDPRVCLEFPTSAQVIMCAEK